MKIVLNLSKTTTLFLIGLLSLSTLFLPLTTLRAATLTNGMNASYVLLQEDFISFNQEVTQDGHASSAGIAVDVAGQRLFVADDRLNRVLVFDYSGGITNGMNASYVLGQSDFTSSASGTTAGLLKSPFGLAYDSVNDRLFVSDLNNYRILVFDVSSISNGENAINVLGQSDFTSSATGTSQSMGSFSRLTVNSAGTRLFVSSDSDHRILVFDVSSISNGENAINVLGQSDFTSASSIAAINGFSEPQGTFLYGNTLYVAESSNNRVVAFDVSAIVDGEDAINVLGQSDFVSNDSTVTQTGMNAPYSVLKNDDSLFVADTANGRILVFDVSSFDDGEAAVNVLGQLNFVTEGSTLTQSGLFSPIDLAYDTTNDYLFVSDVARVLVYDLSTTPTPSSGGSLKYTHPPTCTATFSPSTITKGQPTTLSWNTQWPSEKTSTYYTKVPTQGLYSSKVQSLTLEPQHTTEYTLAIFNLWGANFCTTTITVLDEEGQEITTNPNNSTLTAGVSNSPIVRAITAFFARLFTN